MKAQLVDAVRPSDWLYEIKFDGYRALALRGGTESRILSRNQKDLGKKFTNIRNAIAALDVEEAIIDGEIVALDDKGRPSFQSLQGFDMGWCGRQLFSTPLICYGLTERISGEVKFTEWTRDNRLRRRGSIRSKSGSRKSNAISLPAASLLRSKI